ncbi:MAG: YdbL family protein, partial [Leptospira sp.]|nr:YdbL family protein [Leptospira sp.]
FVKKNPLVKESPFLKEYSKPESSLRVEEIIKITNESREKVYTTRIEKEKKKNISEKELILLKENLILAFHRETTSGEYYEEKKGKWVRKE